MYEEKEGEGEREQEGEGEGEEESERDLMHVCGCRPVDPSAQPFVQTTSVL